MTQVVNGYVSWSSWKSFRIKVISSRDGSKSAKALILFLKSVLRVALLRDPAENVVIVHLSQGGSFVREGLLLRIARARGFATIAQLHGSQFAAYAAKHQARVRAVLGAATRVLVLSAESEQVAQQFVPASRVRLIPNAVVTGIDRPKRQIIVFGGSVSHRKGVDVLVEAWRLVGKADWELVIAGPVKDVDVYDKELPHAIWLGAIPHQELMHWLDQAEIAVLPSRDEAMPMFILEAMARGNCVISTRVGGIPNVLSEGRGVLISPGNVQELASALIATMNDAGARRAVAEAGQRSHHAAFSADVIYPQLESLWSEALCKRDT
ncbi:glycosyltransferase family 4 protein [Hydrocarboniphaga sp.]|uniref:glycosyltransferase family 4 protein n=1 Tax=Hydrocarboniphaga sp. TaxID=2033016 RepID=UPI003D141D9C